MFFVGASGQLLTLILTVCLPFVFLVSSGHQRIDLPQKSLHFESLFNSHEVSTVDNKTFDFVVNTALEYYSSPVEFKDFRFTTIPNEKFLITREPLFVNSSGNKAPPVSISISC